MELEKFESGIKITPEMQCNNVIRTEKGKDERAFAKKRSLTAEDCKTKVTKIKIDEIRKGIYVNKRIEEISINRLHAHPNLKELDPELLSFFAEMMQVNLHSEFSEFVYKHGMSYLDSLCSINFDICPRNDRRNIVKVMEMILKKTNELIEEAKRGL